MCVYSRSVQSWWCLWKGGVLRHGAAVVNVVVVVREHGKDVVYVGVGDTGVIRFGSVMAMDEGTSHRREGKCLRNQVELEVNFNEGFKVRVWT